MFFACRKSTRRKPRTATTAGVFSRSIGSWRADPMRATIARQASGRERARRRMSIISLSRAVGRSSSGGNCFTTSSRNGVGRRPPRAVRRKDRWKSPGTGRCFMRASRRRTARLSTSSICIFARRARFRFKRLVRAEASSRDSSSPPRNGRARRSRRGYSWNACSTPDPAARIVVCGDLNSREHDAPMRILRGARDEDTPDTMPRILVPLAERVNEARRFSVVHGGRKLLLDHILASPALAAACSSVVILNEGLQDEVTAQEPILGSLHAPVIASFVLER